MPVTYIYRLPLYEAYRYSLVYEGFVRPDELDEEGTLHQILTYDREGRLSKAEICRDGEIVTEKSYFFENGRIAREEESFLDTGTKTETFHRYTANGSTREWFTDGALEGREIRIMNDKGIEIGYQLFDSREELIDSWQANEAGDIVSRKSDDREVRFEYDYTEDGLVRERKYVDGEKEVREVSHYQDRKCVKKEVFTDGQCRAYELHQYDAEGRLVRTKYWADNIMVAEVTEDLDPQGRFRIRTEKVFSHAHVSQGGEKLVYEPQRLEILLDGDRRITDVLTCQTKFSESALGIECEPNAYYFFEYED